MLNKEQGAS